MEGNGPSPPPNCSKMRRSCFSEGNALSMFRLGAYIKFGETVTLAVADRDGLQAFVSALGEVVVVGRSAFEAGDAVEHQIVEQSGSADIDIRPNLVVWRLDKSKLNELIGLTTSLIAAGKPAHQYLDEMRSPTTTLMLSIDEFGAGSCT